MNQLDILIGECSNLIEQSESGKVNEADIYRLIDTIVAAYCSEIPNIGFSIGGYSNLPKQPLEDITKIRTKLIAHKEKRVHEKELASLNQGGVNVTQQMTNQIEVSVSLETTVELINNIPPQSLSEEDKTTLTGMLAQIEFASKKGRKDAEIPIRETLKWLGDRSIDVLIAAVPYIARALTGL